MVTDISVEAARYPIVEGFAVRLADQGYYGMQPRFFDGAVRDLGGFGWGDARQWLYRILRFASRFPVSRYRRRQ